MNQQSRLKASDFDDDSTDVQIILKETPGDQPTDATVTITYDLNYATK